MTTPCSILANLVFRSNRAYLCLVLLLSLVSVVHWAYTKRGQSQLQRTGRKQETVDDRRLTVVVYTLPVPRDLQNDHIRRKIHSHQVLSVSLPIPPNWTGQDLTSMA